MRILIYNKFWVFLLIAVLFAACTAEQEVAPIVSPEGNPKAAIEPQGDYAEIKEGDTLKYTITMSAMLKNELDFGVVLQEGSTATDADYEVIGGTLPKFTMSTELWVVVLADDFPEADEVFNFEVSAEGDYAWNFQLAPSSDVEVINNTIINVNDPNAVSIAMSWEDPDHEIDFDLLVENADLGSWSADGATGNNPEIDASIRSDYTATPTDYDGTYYVGVDPYDVPNGDINFTIHVGYPDGTVETFDGVFNMSNLDDYVTDEFTAWGIPMYRMVSVVKAGNTYDVSFDFQP